jgi:Concanavalin A-like lectin/glucanases superfamily/Putative Ig domain
MSHYKGNSMHRYWLILAFLALGLFLAFSPARAGSPAQQIPFRIHSDENVPPGGGDLDQYQPQGTQAGEEPMAVCTPDIPNMLAYWPLNDPANPGATELTFANVAAPLYNGFCTTPGCPTREPAGKVGAAYTFVKYSGDPYTDLPDQIDVPIYPALDWTVNDSFSFETWVKIPTTANCSGNKVFIGRRGNGVFSVWLGCVDGTNKARFSVRDNSGVNDAPGRYIVNGTTVLNNGNWHHVVGVRDAAADKLNLYVDGALEDSVDTAYTMGFSGGKTLGIGYFNTGEALTYNLEGSLDEVAVYKRALTLENVKSHWNGGAGRTYCKESGSGPVVTNPGNKQNMEGDLVSLQIEANDLENGTLNFSASGLPPSLSIATNGLINGQIGCAASTNSPYAVTVTAKNTMTQKSGSASFSWTVTANPDCKPLPEGYKVYLPIALREFP